MKEKKFQEANKRKLLRNEFFQDLEREYNEEPVAVSIGNPMHLVKIPI